MLTYVLLACYFMDGSSIVSVVSEDNPFPVLVAARKNYVVQNSLPDSFKTEVWKDGKRLGQYHDGRNYSILG